MDAVETRQELTRKFEEGCDRFERDTKCYFDSDKTDRWIEFVIKPEDLALTAAYSAQFANNFFAERGLGNTRGLRNYNGLNKIAGEPDIVKDWLLESNAATDLLISILNSAHGRHPALEEMREGIYSRNDESDNQDLSDDGCNYILKIYYSAAEGRAKRGG
jgi:hypothetical protein